MSLYIIEGAAEETSYFIIFDILLYFFLNKANFSVLFFVNCLHHYSLQRLKICKVTLILLICKSHHFVVVSYSVGKVPLHTFECYLLFPHFSCVTDSCRSTKLNIYLDIIKRTGFLLSTIKNTRNNVIFQPLP